MVLTEKQLQMLVLLGQGPRHVYGSKVRVVRRLEELGLADLRDDGELGPGGRGNWDGERWWARISSQGEGFLKSLGATQ